jgi:hypothetical protein
MLLSRPSDRDSTDKSANQVLRRVLALQIRKVYGAARLEQMYQKALLTEKQQEGRMFGIMNLSEAASARPRHDQNVPSGAAPVEALQATAGHCINPTDGPHNT